MALQFQPPPTDLIKDYIASRDRNYGLETLDSVQKSAAMYITLKQQQQLIDLKKSEEQRQIATLALAEQKGAREQGTYAREYAPAELPGAGGAYNQYSPQDMGQAQGSTLTGDAQMRSMLTQEQGMGQPSLSPYISHWNETQGQANPGIGMAQNTALAPAPKNPQEQANLEFATQTPQGSKIALEQSQAEENRAKAELYRKGWPGAGGGRPADQKRTFQMVGFEGDTPVSFDTRSGELVRGSPTTVPLSPKVAPSIPGASVEKFGDLENLKQKMSVLRENYSPDYVGMVDAPTQALKQKTGIGASKQAAFFKQTTQDIKDSLLRARSGAQINEQEYKRLLPLVPNETMSEVDFLAKADRFDQVLNEMLTSKQGAFQKAGYRTPDFSGGSSGGFSDAQKESRYQAWKAKQGQP